MLALSACTSGTPSSVPTDTGAPAPTQKAETATAPATSASTEVEDSEDLPWWDGFDFGPNIEYREEIVALSDPGEYMNAAEAAKYTFDAVRDNGYVPEYSDSMQYAMVLVDIRALYEEGEECYVYRLDIDEPTGTLGAAYGCAYQSGNIYMEGDGGEFVLILGDGDWRDPGDSERGDVFGDPGDGSWSDPGDLGASDDGRGDVFPGDWSDPGDSGDANWWGEYKTDSWSIGIVNYNGQGFRFTFYNLRNGAEITDGVAAVHPDNVFLAEYVPFEFWLSEDSNVIQVFVPADNEFSELAGDYARID
jgi:hypothetical protein